MSAPAGAADRSDACRDDDGRLPRQRQALLGERGTREERLRQRVKPPICFSVSSVGFGEAERRRRAKAEQLESRKNSVLSGLCASRRSTKLGSGNQDSSTFARAFENQVVSLAYGAAAVQTVGSSLCFMLMAVLVKVSSFSALEVCFARCLMQLVMANVVLGSHGLSWCSYWADVNRLMVLRALLDVTGVTLYYMAVDALPLSVALAIGVNALPILVLPLSIVCNGENVDVTTAAYCFAGVVGVFMVTLDPDMVQEQKYAHGQTVWMGRLCALIALLVHSIAITLNTRVAPYVHYCQSNNAFAVAGLVLLPVALALVEARPLELAEAGATDIAAILTLSVAAFVGQVLQHQSSQVLPATDVAAFRSLEAVFSLVSQAVVLACLPTIAGAMGALLIVLSAFGKALHSRQNMMGRLTTARRGLPSHMPSM
eukprot:TRINITY_DN27688_c1_g1_i1.p1 TRINITY_DN27688_c1_g1~~TRINITY_DN27688_c1_g1_i1.p1  ORF type:complete len:428 (+),score=97.92 TRINITY_DN27688_c1_g1_i1:104-1387(+)